MSGTFQDVDAGIDHLAKLARKHPLDPTRVAIGGRSAGAHLALWGGARAKLGSAFRPRVRAGAIVAINGRAALAPFIGIDAKVCGKPVIVRVMGGTPVAMSDA